MKHKQAKISRRQNQWKRLQRQKKQKFVTKLIVTRNRSGYRKQKNQREKLRLKWPFNQSINQSINTKVWHNLTH